MNIAYIWLIKIILAHLLTDFVLQPSKWTLNRNKLHFRSPYLYLHGLITGAVGLLLVGLQYYKTIVVIMITHILIDVLKSYLKPNLKFFLLDQLAHLAVILLCWYFIFLQPNDIVQAWTHIDNKKVWILVTAFVFITQPVSILIDQLTKRMRDELEDGFSLGNSGKWIGIIERIIILALVLNHEYEAIGFLIAAKAIRFTNADSQRIRIEYFFIGTLLSFGLALLTGLVALRLIE